MEQWLTVKVSPKRIPKELLIRDLDSSDYNRDDFSQLNASWTAVDKYVKATAGSDAFTYTSVTYPGGIDPGRALKVGAAIGKIYTDYSYNGITLSVENISITGGAKDTKYSDYKVSPDDRAFTIPASDAGKTLKVGMTLRDSEGNEYEIPEAYVIKVNNILTSVRIAEAKVNKNEPAGYTLTQEPGTKKTYNLTGITAGASIENVKAQAYLGTAAKLTIDPYGSRVDATVHPDQKTITVRVLEPLLNTDNEKTTIVLFNDIDGSGGYNDNAEFLQAVTMITTDSPLASVTPTVKVASATDATLSLTLGLPDNMKNSFASKEGDYVYEVRLTPQAGYEEYNERVFYVKAVGMSQTETFKMLLKDGESAPRTVGNGGKAVFTAEIKAVYFASTLYTEDTENGPNFVRENEFMRHYDPQNAQYDVLGESRVYNSGKATTFATKDSIYPSSLTSKVVNAKIYAGQEYTEDLVIANLTPNATAGAVPDSGYRVTDITEDPQGYYYWGGSVYTWRNVYLDSYDQHDGCNPSDCPVAKVRNGQLVIEKNELNKLRNKPLNFSAKPYKIKVTAPREHDYDQEVSTIVNVSLETRAVGRKHFDEITGDDPYDVWFNDDPYTIGSEITLVKKSGTALTKKFTLNYDGRYTKASNNAFEWSLTDFENMNSKDVTINQSGQVTVNKDFAFQASSLYAPSFKVKAVSKYNSGELYPTELSCRITLVNAEEADQMGELVVVAPKYDMSDKVTGYTIIARNNSAMTMFDDLHQYQHRNNAFLAVLKKGAPVMEVISPDWLYSTADYNVTSSNRKIFEVLNVCYNEDGTVRSGAPNTMKYADGRPNKFLQSLYVPGTGVGKATLTAVTPGGDKASMNLTLKAAQFKNMPGTTANYFSLLKINNPGDTSGVIASNANYQQEPMKAEDSYKAKKATLDYEEPSNTVLIRVATVEAQLDDKGDAVGFAPNSMQDYFNVTPSFKNATVLDADPLTGNYKIQLVGRTATATLNGVTYTINNHFYDHAEASSVKRTTAQTTKAYANMIGAPAVQFKTTSGSKKAEDQAVDTAIKYAVITCDRTNAASQTMFDEYLAGPITDERIVVPTTDLSDAGGLKYKGFSLSFDSGAMKAGSYNLYVQYAKDADVAVSENMITEPKVFTVKVENPPVFNPVTAYTVEITTLSENNSGFAFVGKDKRAARITGVTNYNTNGVNNNFIGLIAQDDINNELMLNSKEGAYEEGYVTINSAEFAKASASDLKGYVTYTADGGLTEKTVLVTLTRKISDSIGLTPVYTQAETSSPTWINDSTLDPDSYKLPYTVMENVYNAQTKKSAWVKASNSGNGNSYKYYSDIQFALEKTSAGEADSMIIGTKKAGEYTVTATIKNTDTNEVQTLNPTQTKINNNEAWVFKGKLNGPSDIEYQFVKNIGVKATVSSDKVTNGARITMTINKDAGNLSSTAATLRSGTEVLVPEANMVRIEYSMNAGYEPVLQRVEYTAEGYESVYDVPWNSGTDHVFDPATRKGVVKFVANGDGKSLETYRIGAVKKNWVTINKPYGMPVSYALSADGSVPDDSEFKEDTDSASFSFPASAGQKLFLKYGLPDGEVLARNGIVMPKGMSCSTVYKDCGADDNSMGIDPQHACRTVDHVVTTIPDASATEIRFETETGVKISVELRPGSSSLAPGQGNLLITDDETAPVGRWISEHEFLYNSYDLSKLEIRKQESQGPTAVNKVTVERKTDYDSGALSRYPATESITLYVDP